VKLRVSSQVAEEDQPLVARRLASVVSEYGWALRGAIYCTLTELAERSMGFEDPNPDFSPRRLS
jgi:hypothetical protein